MKLSRVVLFFATGIVMPLLSAAAPPRPALPASTVSVLERGPNHRRVRQVGWQTNALGTISVRTNTYTELATGLHYLENGEWKESKEEIEILPNGAGAVARHGGHKVIFAPNLNTEGVIDLETPDGTRLRSHILALGYYDRASGRSEIIAQVKSSEGELVGDNQVLYRDAFDGLRADVRFTYRKSGFEQDVILRSRPPAPEKYKLDPKTTRLEVFTEFLDAPTPTKTLSAIPGTALTDEKLTFGRMTMGLGRAFPLAGGPNRKSAVYTGKTWINHQGRTILLEEVEYKTVEKHLKELPAANKTAQLKTKTEGKLLADGRKIPGKLLAAAKNQPTKPMRLAAREVEASGFVLDYVSVAEWTEDQDAVFQSGETYFISAGYWPNSLTIQAGAVIKFADDPISLGWGHTLAGNGVLTCPSSGYAYLTSMHDNSIGEEIDDSTGQPDLSVGAIFLELANGAARIHNLYFKYAVAGLVGGAATDNQIRDCAFVDCQVGVMGYGAVGLTNTWFSDCSVLVDYSWLGSEPGVCNVQAERVKDLTGSTVLLVDSGANLASTTLGLHKCCFSSPAQISEINALGTAIITAGGAFVYTPLCVTGDADGDWLQDSWENQFFKNLGQSAEDDYDHDGLTNWQENQAGSDPINMDSDGDGLPDSYEVKTLHSNPALADTGSTGTSDGYKDADGDGLTNLEELKLGKNPAVPDVAAPIFAPVGRSYAVAQSVTITCPTPGATIRYTLSGEEPDLNSQTILSGASVLVDQTFQTLKAKAWKANWTASETESQSYVIEATPSNLSPTLTVSPASGGTFLASDSIEFLVEAADDSGVGKVQLYRGSYKVAETTTSPLRHKAANLPAGTYTFTAKAFDDMGAVTVSAPITITINASGPMVSLVGTQPFWTSSPGTLIANITGVNPEAVTTLTLNGVAVTPKRAGEFKINVALSQGENTFTLIANGVSATTKVYLDSIAPVVAITAPANGAIFSTTRANISGTFTEASLKRITVNGILAFASSGTFTALNVPLATGANTIIATAEDIAGNVTTHTINLTGGSTLVDPVQLNTSTVGGFETLAVTFTPTANVPGTLQYVYYDFNGDGVNDQTETSLSVTPSHSYAAGEYFPVVTVQTTAGKFSSLGGWNASTLDRLRINVQTAPQQVGSAISIPDPVDLKVTADGHLYILSKNAATIYEYDATPAPIRSVTIPGTSPEPTGLDVDASGNVYVAISGQNKVAKYRHNPGTGALELDTTFGTGGFIGSAGTGDGQFNSPYDVAVSPDGQEIVVSDSSNHRIQRFSVSYFGFFVSKYGSQGSGAGEFNTPKGLTFDDQGQLFVVDSGNNRVVLTSSSSTLGTSGSAGTALGQFSGAVNLCIGARGIYVADAGNNRVQAFEPVISLKGLLPVPFNARLALSTGFSPSLAQPAAIAPIADFLAEKIYIADTGNNRVIKAILPEITTPDVVWTAMKTSLNNGDIDGAVSQCSTSAGTDYRKAFLSIGISKASADINATGSLTPVFISGDTAQSYFSKNLFGQDLIFTVDFVKENGKWKISSF